MVMGRSLPERKLIQNICVQHIVLSQRDVLAKYLGVLVENLLERLTKHGSLCRYNQTRGNLDEWLVLSNIINGHAAWVLVVTRTEHNWVLYLRMDDSFCVAPLKEFLEPIPFLFRSPLLQIVRISFALLCRFSNTLDGVEELEKTKLSFNIHFKFYLAPLQSITN